MQRDEERKVTHAFGCAGGSTGEDDVRDVVGSDIDCVQLEDAVGVSRFVRNDVVDVHSSERRETDVFCGTVYKNESSVGRFDDCEESCQWLSGTQRSVTGARHHDGNDAKYGGE